MYKKQENKILTIQKTRKIIRMLRDCRDNEEYNNEKDIGKDIKRVSFHCILLRNRNVSSIAVVAFLESSGDECRRKALSKKAVKKKF